MWGGWRRKNKNGMIVIYWPLTEPSIKRCTCVNKRENSGSRCTLDNNITRCTDGSSQLETRCQRENQIADWGLCGPQWPTVEQPKARWERSAAVVEKELGVKMTVRPCLHSFLTHNKHHPFENKVWEIYFYKEVYSFIIEVAITVNDASTCKCIFVNVHVQLYYGCEYTTFWCVFQIGSN